MQGDLVSTIIPVFNRPEMLRDAVESVLRQSYKNIEIIIVNDGSTDSTFTVAQELQSQHENIKSISIENAGPAIARQHGLELAQGKFIQFLDSDDLLLPTKFEQQVSVLKAQPSHDVCYCVQELRHINGELIEAAWMRTGERFESMFPAMLGGRIWGTPVPLYRTSLLKKVGPWLNLSNQEDWEYDCRIASLGTRLSYCPDTLVTIRSHQDEHFGQIDSNDTQKLNDKSKAYLAIFAHAQNAKIDFQNEESLRFNRMTFMLARQCAHAGLIQQAKELLATCILSAHNRKRQFEYQVYSVISNLIGWQTTGKLSARLDKFRL